MLLFGVLLLGVVPQVGAVCSYSDANLVNWDSKEAWANGKVPKAQQKAVIANGKRVRLNVSPPDLTGIIIESNASLVWGDFGGLVLTTEHILIKGDFIIGDEDCRFTKKAHIRLTGKSDSKNKHDEFGVKYIGVDEGGAIEIHGTEKLTWTNLIETVQPAAKTCGVVFNFEDTVYGEEGGKGLFVFAFNLDGSLFDFSIFKTESKDAGHAYEEDDFADFLQNIPNNKILMVAVNGDLGTKTAKRDWNKIYTAVEQVGGITSTVLRNVQGREAYAMITKTGSSDTTREQHAVQYADPATPYAITDQLSILDGTNDLVYSVTSKVAASVNTNRGVDVKVLTKDSGRPKIKLNADVSSWEEDDEIVMASTDFDWRQAEVFKVASCSDCAVNEIRLNRPAKYLHYGDITYGVDERAEVGVLTRNILIEGILEDECYINDKKDKKLCGYFNRDTHGGHIKIVRYFRAAHIEGAEIYHMGQQKFLGKYSLHFHMCDDVNGNWFRNNSIHRSNTRCVTIHGTDHSEVSDNLCFETFGHSYFLEDSAEQWNIFQGNLGLGTQFGSLLLSDMNVEWCDTKLQEYCGAVATFWITHPNNIFRNNAAAGSDVTGFWFLVAFKPLGPSYQRQKERGLVWDGHAFHSKVLEFSGNVAHSCVSHGVRMDNRISNGEVIEGVYVPLNGVVSAATSHVAMDPPRANGTRVISRLSGLVAYKNGVRHIWTKGGNLEMENFRFADSPLAVMMARTTYQTYTRISNSLFIGESDNKGLEDAPFGRSNPTRFDNQPITGVGFYQGPGIVENCYFDKFEPKITETFLRAGSAFGFKQSNPYPSQVNSGVKQIQFGYCDKTEGNYVFQGNTSVFYHYLNRDGNKQISFRDYDGSVTGTAGTQIVRNVPIYTTPRCVYRSNWNMAVCPYEYCRVFFEGEGGVFKTKPKNYPVILRRDDRPDDPFALQGERLSTYLALKNYSYILTFNGTVPKEVKLSAENMLPGDFLRIGFCFPKDTKRFEFRGTLPEINGKIPAIEVKTIEALDADTTMRAYFWDKARGLLFVKVVGLKTRVNFEKCPGHECPRIKIYRVGGSDGPVDCYKDAYRSGVYRKPEDWARDDNSMKCTGNDCHYNTNTEGEIVVILLSGKTTTPIPKEPKCKISKPDGIGGPPMALNYPTGNYQPKCAVTPTYPESRLLGCFVDHPNHRDLPHAHVELYRSMTPSFCVQRCYHRGYAYAGLQNGNRCYCGNYYGAFGEAPNECTETCNGDESEECGGINRNTVYSTGKVTPPAQDTCGPDQEGVVIEGKCYYLTKEETQYTDGQRACVKLGGNLATINSEDIQAGVQVYLRSKKQNVWFGLNDAIEPGTHQWVDGTAYDADGYDNTLDNQGAKDNKVFYILKADVLYAWSDAFPIEEYRALCQIPDDATPPAASSCGTDNAGKKFENGGCYAVINEQGSWEHSVYACYTRMGTPVTITDSNREDILQHVYLFGTSVGYWTGESAGKDTYYELAFRNLYNKEQDKRAVLKGVVCEIDTLSASKPCGNGWKQVNNKCYLYTATTARSFEIAKALCEQGVSRMVKIGSEDENEEVVDHVTDYSFKSVFLGLKYDKSSSTFLWQDDNTTVYSSWAKGHGVPAKGECVTLRPKKGDWMNVKCNKSATVFCEADART